MSRGTVPTKLFAERSNNSMLLRSVPAGNVPDRLLAANRSVSSDADELNAGSVPLNQLLLARTS